MAEEPKSSGGISIGGNVGGNIIFGNNNTVNIQQGVTGQDLVALFGGIQKQIEARPEDPKVDKEEISATVDRIQKEAAKGEEGNAEKIARWLNTLSDLAPDILSVTAAALVNPVAGVAAGIKVVAERFAKGQSKA
jgi:hypothetical protein